MSKEEQYFCPQIDYLNDFETLNTISGNKDNNNNESPNDIDHNNSDVIDSDSHINDNTCDLVNENVTAVESDESNDDDQAPLVEEDLKAEMKYNSKSFTRNCQLSVFFPFPEQV